MKVANQAMKSKTEEGAIKKKLNNHKRELNQLCRGREAISRKCVRKLIRARVQSVATRTVSRAAAERRRRARKRAKMTAMTRKTAMMRKSKV
jgi:hypothetical protein